MNKKIEKYNIKRNKENSKLINLKINYRLEIKNDSLKLFDGNKKVLVGEYSFYGIYQSSSKLWIWASSIPGVNKKHLENIKKIKEMNHLFEGDDNIKMNFYYQLLTQDVILITEDIFLEWICDLIMYLSNDILIFTPTNSESNIQYITMKSVKEKYK
jgi:hypothetical protein